MEVFFSTNGGFVYDPGFQNRKIILTLFHSEKSIERQTVFWMVIFHPRSYKFVKNCFVKKAIKT